jgi:tungstate transport system ATP-binding protein
MKRDAFDGAPVPSPLHDAPAARQQASGADSPLLFDLDRVCVRLGPVLALQDVSVRLRHGERVALVGANGCGKSTMLRLLNGLLQPAGGRIVRDAAARQALLFQRPYMLRTTARNNIALGLWMGGLGWADAKRRAVQALDRVGMAGLAGRNAKTLSGGQQQRLALARAWAASPDVLLLDEPTASLDPRAKHDVETLVAEFTTGALADGARRGPDRDGVDHVDRAVRPVRPPAAGLQGRQRHRRARGRRGHRPGAGHRAPRRRRRAVRARHGGRGEVRRRRLLRQAPERDVQRLRAGRAPRPTRPRSAATTSPPR